MWKEVIVANFEVIISVFERTDWRDPQKATNHVLGPRSEPRISRIQSGALFGHYTKANQEAKQ